MSNPAVTSPDPPGDQPAVTSPDPPGDQPAVTSPDPPGDQPAVTSPDPPGDQPAVTSPDPPGAQPSGAAVNSSTNAAGRPGGGTQGFGSYFRTLPGILKIVSVVLGLLAMSLTVYANNNCLWFQRAYVEHCQEGYGCVDEYEKITWEGYCNKFDSDCPSWRLVSPQMFLIAFSWAGTLIVLIVLIFIDLRKSPTFVTVDMIVHLVAGILVIVSGLCLVGFCASVLTFNYCKRPRLKPQFLRTNQGNFSNTTASGRRLYGWNTDASQTCADEEYNAFKHWHILVGGISALATGALYVVIAIMSLKSRRGQQVRPMRTA